MGGSPPSPPTVVMPAPTAPTTYRSVVPLESYEQTAGYLKRLTEKTEDILKQRYQEVGTPAELGARQAGRRSAEEASYLGSIPTTDKYIAETTGQVDRFEKTREAAKLSSTSAANEYLEALKKVSEKPKAVTYVEPEWAKSTT